MKCTKCGTDEALQLLNSLLCVNHKCQFYDEKWAIEQGHIELDDLELQDLNSFQNPPITINGGTLIITGGTGTSSGSGGTITILSGSSTTSSNSIAIGKSATISNPGSIAIGNAANAYP